MKAFLSEDLKRLYISPKDSHKGQNGKLLIIGGSQLFHGASLWALKVASRIVDMVFYASTPENNELAQKLKRELYDFIAIPREKISDYINEADCILIGPGLPREEGKEKGDDDTKDLTKNFLKAYPDKKWVIDGGSLQVMDPKLLKTLNGNVIVTPHKGEFEKLFNIVIADSDPQSPPGRNEMPDRVRHDIERIAKEYNCVILLKGQTDIVCPPSRGEAGSPNECLEVTGGNPGMTKGGTGDVLAGLIAALACKNDLFLAAAAGSFINKKAGDSLYKKVGPYFNASDLADEIPKVMKEFIPSEP